MQVGLTRILSTNFHGPGKSLSRPVSSWWSIFFLLGHSPEGSNTVLLHSDCSLRRTKVCSEGVCFPRWQNLSCSYYGDGFLVKHNTTTSCSVAHKGRTWDNIQLEALYAQRKKYTSLHNGSDRGTAQGHKFEKSNKKNIVFFFSLFFKDFLSRGQETSLIPMI